MAYDEELAHRVHAAAADALSRPQRALGDRVERAVGFLTTVPWKR